MKLVINEENLTIDDMQEFKSKVRAILVDESNRILIAHYGNIILLPGGSIDNHETIYDAIRREFHEEIGQDYIDGELDFIATLVYYQKDYPKMNGAILNRLVQTHYFVGAYKGIFSNLQQLTKREQNGNFRLELVSLEELEMLY